MIKIHTTAIPFNILLKYTELYYHSSNGTVIGKKERDRKCADCQTDR